MVIEPLSGSLAEEADGRGILTNEMQIEEMVSGPERSRMHKSFDDGVLKYSS